MEMVILGWAASQAARNKDGWLKGWLMSEAGDAMLSVVGVVAVAVAMAI